MRKAADACRERSGFAKVPDLFCKSTRLPQIHGQDLVLWRGCFGGKDTNEAQVLVAWLLESEWAFFGDKGRVLLVVLH